MKPSTVAIGLLIVLGAVAVGFAAAPPQEGGRGPQGTLALRRFLARMDLETTESARPGAGTFVLLADIRDEDGAEDVLEWVEDGGRLVLAEPESTVASALEVQPAAELPPVLPGARLVRPECEAFDGTGVGAITVSANEPSLEAPSQAERCFPGRDGPHMAIVQHGRGQVVVFSGASAFTNQFLDSRDNALMAYRLFAGFDPVAFGPAIDPSSIAPAGPWNTLPSGARSSISILVLALVLFALVRGRRFGRPVQEEPLSPIPSSQLVGATAGLYQSAGVADFAGDLLREGTAARISKKLGLPVGAGIDDVDAVARGALAERGALADVLAAPDPTNDTELIELARDLDRLEKAVEAL